MIQQVAKSLCIVLAVTLQIPSMSFAAQVSTRTAHDPNLALAKSGDRHHQQQFVCELYSADKQRMQSMGFSEVPQIGGWFAIQFYRELLSPEARVRYMIAKKGAATDSGAITEPRLWTLALLPKIVSNPPVRAIDSSAGLEELQRYAQIWRDWIRVNESSLRKLQPTGEGVDFSGRTCQTTMRPVQLPHPATGH
jgi:hypothetical protein